MAILTAASSVAHAPGQRKYRVPPSHSEIQRLVYAEENEDNRALASGTRSYGHRARKPEQPMYETNAPESLSQHCKALASGTESYGQRDIDIRTVQPIESLVERSRAAIDELTELEPGWDSYDGLPVHARVAEHALRFLEAIGDATRIVPDIVPLSNGGLQLEWYVGAYELEVSISPECEVEAYFESKCDGRIEEIPIDASLDVSQIVPLFRELRR